MTLKKTDLEQLFWRLAKIVDDADSGLSLHGILDCVNVNRAFVRQVMEHVQRLDSLLALCIAASLYMPISSTINIIRRPCMY